MKTIYRYIPLQLLLFLILGILAQYYFQFLVLNLLVLGVGFGTLLILFIFIKNRWILTLLAFCSFFFLGASSVLLHNPQAYSNYFAKADVTNDKLTLKITAQLKPNAYYNSYTARVLSVGNVATSGSVLLTIKKDSLQSQLAVDAILLAPNVIQPIAAPLNPHQFNYKNYLKNKGVTAQLSLTTKRYVIVSNAATTIFGVASRFRNQLLQSLLNYKFTPDQRAIINALVLGERQTASKELLTSYKNAGAIHILAISGLHIGIVFLFLNTLLSPFGRLKNGAVVKTILILIVLWCFAIITGFSASVVRAVTMFTFIAVGQLLNRPRSTLFSLIASLLFLLIIRPLFLFDVGFQLSYLAVFGIIIVQPKLAALFSIKPLIFRKIWELFTVSLAAQLAILPLSIYYFNQFPSLFFITNILIIPCIGVLLGFGFVVVFLAYMAVLPQFITTIYGGIIDVLNFCIAFIAKQEAFLFTELSLSFLKMLVYYSLIIAGYYLFYYKTAKTVVVFLIMLLTLQILVVVEQQNRFNTTEFIVFQKTKHSILAQRKQGVLQVYSTLKENTLSEEFLIKKYKIAAGVHTTYKPLLNVLNYKKDVILIVDSLAVYNVSLPKPPIVILQHSPKLNLQRLITQLQPKQLIVDGSNYISYAHFCKKVATANGVPFYNTAAQGAFILP